MGVFADKATAGAAGWPEGAEEASHTRRRRSRGWAWRVAIRCSTIFGLLVLTTLLYNVVNSTWGYVVVRDQLSDQLIVLLERSHVTHAERRVDALKEVAGNPNAVVVLTPNLVPAVPDGYRTVPIGDQHAKLALIALVSEDNEFLLELDEALLLKLLPEGSRWSDLVSSWPAESVSLVLVVDEDGILSRWAARQDLTTLDSLGAAELLSVLETHLSAGLIRRYDRDEPMAERSRANLLSLVEERVKKPEVLATFNLRESLVQPAEIKAFADVEGAVASFHSWLTPGFLVRPQSANAAISGIRTALLGSLWVIAITICFSVPLGIGAAIYLEEFSTRNWFGRIVETNINNLAGVPSIIYGMLGLVIFVRALTQITSGSLFGAVSADEASGRTILSAGLTLGLLILPVIIINGQEAIRAVPDSLREAAYGVGCTRWQCVRWHVLPMAVPGILTGAILAVSRALGETAPLVVIGAATFISVDPTSLFAKFTVLPIQIYQWTARPQAEFRNIAAAAILVLLALLLVTNATAVLLRNRAESQRM